MSRCVWGLCLFGWLFGFSFDPKDYLERTSFLDFLWARFFFLQSCTIVLSLERDNFSTNVVETPLQIIIQRSHATKQQLICARWLGGKCCQIHSLSSTFQNRPCPSAIRRMRPFFSFVFRLRISVFPSGASCLSVKARRPNPWKSGAR